MIRPDARNVMMAGKRLPYDAEVEYLESTGTQYIDTGIKIDSTLSITARCNISRQMVRYVWGNVSTTFAQTRRGGRVTLGESQMFAALPRKQALPYEAELEWLYGLNGAYIGTAVARRAVCR